MTGPHLYGFLVSILVVFVPALPQAGTEPPLTMQQVESLFNYEKSRPAFKDSTIKEVDRLGVEFVLDRETEQRFRALKMDQNLLDLIRSRAKITGLTVQCEGAECEVSINNEVKGTTVGSRLDISPVKPGMITIKVTNEPNFEMQTAEVRVSPGQHLTVEKFTMVPKRGGLDLTCVPAPVCGITITGPAGFVKKGATTDGRFSAQGLPLGGYEVEASAPPEFLPKSEKFWITAPDIHKLAMKLEEDPWGSKIDSQVFDAIVGALGGKTVLTVGSSSRNNGLMHLVGDPPSIGIRNGIQLVEYVAPDRQRWDMKIAGSDWKVVYGGTTVTSAGDKRTFAGTEFAQELEHSIRLFSTMRLPRLLSLIREKFDITKGPNLVLIADAIDKSERYTFQLNADFQPVTVRHEVLSGRRSQVEVEFSQYKPIGQDLVLPHVMTLRYPDRPKHEHTFEYEKIDPMAPIREDTFKAVK